MSRLFIAGGGAFNLARRSHTPCVNLITTLPIKSSLPRAKIFPSPQCTQIRHKWSWPVWIGLHPTSLEEVQTVYRACTESRVFGPQSWRPITPHGQVKRTRATHHNIRETFLETDGLKPADWHNRGIGWNHALEITLRLHQERLFSQQPDTEKKLKQVIANWNSYWAKARSEHAEEFDTARTKVLQGDGDVSRIDAARKVQEGIRSGNKLAVSAHGVAKAREKRKTQDEIDLEKKLAAQARRVAKACKTMEEDSDRAEGIKSKRRPTWQLPLHSMDVKNLREMNKQGREHLVDKVVKKWAAGEQLTSEEEVEAWREHVLRKRKNLKDLVRQQFGQLKFEKERKETSMSSEQSDLAAKDLNGRAKGPERREESSQPHKQEGAREGKLTGVRNGAEQGTLRRKLQALKNKFMPSSRT